MASMSKAIDDCSFVQMPSACVINFPNLLPSFILPSLINWCVYLGIRVIDIPRKTCGFHGVYVAINYLSGCDVCGILGSV